MEQASCFATQKSPRTPIKPKKKVNDSKIVHSSCLYCTKLLSFEFLNKNGVIRKNFEINLFCYIFSIFIIA